MTSYLMSDRFMITGIQLGLLHMLTDYNDRATEIVEEVLKQKMEEAKK